MSAYLRLSCVTPSALLIRPHRSPVWKRWVFFSTLALVAGAGARAELTDEERHKIVNLKFDAILQTQDKAEDVRRKWANRSLGEDNKSAKDTDEKAQADAIKKTDDASKSAEQSVAEKLAVWGFGGGVGILQLSGARPVDTATVDSGNVVRITTKSKTRIGPILEGHYVFSDLSVNQKDVASAISEMRAQSFAAHETPDQLAKRISTNSHRTFAFVATAELGENTFRSFGLGVMFCLQRYTLTGDNVITLKGPAFNVGLITFAEANVKRVQGAYVDGQTVPAGTVMRLEEEGRYGFGLVFSTRF
ncbi:MAG: hypothetical protein NTV51_10795 [Verrucomicrobia bacterium]|nr:hypothetical protein [Verrucomicrobiota bacterium]